MLILLGTAEIPECIISWARAVQIDLNDSPNVSVYEANVGYCVHTDEPYRNYFIGDSREYADRDWHLPLYINLSPTYNSVETHITPESVCCGYTVPIKDQGLYQIPITFTREDMYQIIEKRFKEEYPNADPLNDDACSCGMRHVLERLSNPINECKCIKDALDQMCRYSISPFNDMVAYSKREKKIVWLN